MGRVEDKIAIVTGAAQGIGRAAAEALAAEGAAVIVADVNEETGTETAASIVTSGGTARFTEADVGDTDQVRALVESTVERYGGLDILVNNAAVALSGTVTDIEEETWQRVLNTNLSGVWRCMKFGIPHMIRRGGGAIVNVASVQGLIGFPGWSAYAAAKGGVDALTRQAAVEYAPHGVRVNSVAPGTIMTPMNDRIFREAPDPEALIDSWNAMHPLGRFGESQEVARTILFLASDEASFITGDTVRVDGGAAINGR